MYKADKYTYPRRLASTVDQGGSRKYLTRMNIQNKTYFAPSKGIKSNGKKSICSNPQGSLCVLYNATSAKEYSYG